MKCRIHAHPPVGLIAVALYVSTQPGIFAQGVSPAHVEMQFTSPSYQATPIDVGDALMAHQRYQAAIEAYKKAPSDSAEAWNKMGLAYHLMRNVNEAARCYQHALKLNPRNGTYENNLGAVSMEHKDYSHAVKSFRKAIKKSPDTALFEKNLGTALLAAHKYDEGWQAYQRALVLDPHIFERSLDSVRVDNPSTVQDRGAMNYYMAKGCVKAGMLAKAVDYLRMALDEGFTNSKKILADTDFSPLHDLPAFRQMMEAQGVYLASTSTSSTLVH